MSDDTPEPTEPHTPVQAEPQASEEAKRPREPLHVPRWAAAVLAALVLVGVGFGIGWFAAPGGGHNTEVPRVGRFSPGGPGFGAGRGPFNGPGVGGANPGTQSGAFLGIATTATSGGQQGAQVVQVQSGSPADQAGLKAGDVITAVNGTTVADPAALSQQILSHQPGDQVTITYTRAGSSAQVQVKLGTRSQATLPTAPPS